MAAVTTPARAVASATPYPWPYHGALDASRLALLACVDPAWRGAEAERVRADALLAELAAAVRACGGLVVAIGSAAAGPLGPAVAVESWSANGFHETRLENVLRLSRRSDLLIAGWGLEGPVHSTLRAANDRGYECLLVADACTAHDPALREPACSMVRHSGGIFGAHASTREVVASLRELPAGPLATSRA